jgi:F0F1-type ATP synthase alpha subunit
MVHDWEQKFLAFMREQKPEIRSKLVDTKKMDDDTADAIERAIKEFQAQYSAKREEKQLVAAH